MPRGVPPATVVETARDGGRRAWPAPRRKNVVFTSGGTEANALALTPGLGRSGRPVLPAGCWSSAIEHPSVLCGGQFPAESVELVPVSRDGVVDLGALADRLLANTADAVPLVSIMLANNETGVIQPVAAVGRAGPCRRADSCMSTRSRHPDELIFDIKELNADLMTLFRAQAGRAARASAR